MPKATSYPSSKLKQWEKERRERLNICFRDLGSLLPSHDPAISLSKVQILQKAAKYIRELQSENKVLVENGVSEVSAKHLQVLRQRSDDLLRRVQQLVELLRDAGIAVPHAVSLKNEPLKQRQLKWDNKIKPEDAKILEEKAKNKNSENKKKVQKGKKSVGSRSDSCNEAKLLKSKALVQKRSRTWCSSNTSTCPSRTKGPLERLEPPRDENCRPVQRPRSSGAFTCTALPARIGALGSRSTSSLSHLVGSGVVQATSVSHGKNVSVSATDSHLLTAPVVSTSVEARPSLPSGTLIFADGSMVPVVPTQQTVIATPARYIVNTSRHQVPVLHKSSVVVVHKNTLPPASKKSSAFPLLIPKRRTDTVKIKFPNKVAISASASRFLPLELKSHSNCVTMSVKTSANKRILHAPLQVTTDSAVTNKDKLTGNAKRRKVPNISKSVDEENITKQKIVCDKVLNQASETCSVAKSSTKSKNAVVSTRPTKVDGQSGVTTATSTFTADSGMVENSNEDGNAVNLQNSSVQKLCDRRLKKRINSKKNINNFKIKKKLKVLQTLKNGERSNKPSNMKSVQNHCIVSTSASNEKLSSSSSTAVQQSGRCIIEDNANMSLSDPSNTMSADVPRDNIQQNNVTVTLDVLKDRNGNKYTGTTCDDPQRTVAGSVCESGTKCSTISTPETGCMFSDNHTISAGGSQAAAATVDHVMQNFLGRQTQDSTNTELPEKVGEAISCESVSSSLACSVSRKDGQQSGIDDSRTVEGGNTIGEINSRGKPKEHISVNNVTTKSMSDVVFPEVIHTEDIPRGTTDRMTQVKDDSKIASQDLHKVIGNCNSVCSTLAAPVPSTVSDGQQNRVYIDGMSKKNMFGIYTIDALCKTTVAVKNTDSELLTKDILESVPSSSNTDVTSTNSGDMNISVANMKARLIETSKSIVPNEQYVVNNNDVSMQINSDDNNILRKQITDGFKSEGNKYSNKISNISSDSMSVSTSQNVSNSVSEFLSRQEVQSNQGVSGFLPYDACVHSESVPEPIVSKRNLVSKSNPDQHGVSQEKQLLVPTNPKVTKQISACLREVCVSANPTEVSMSTSMSTATETIKQFTKNTPHNCDTSTPEISFQGGEQPIVPKTDKHNKHAATSRSEDTIFPVETKLFSSTTSTVTLPSDANEYMSSNSVPNVPLNCQVNSAKNLTPTQCCETCVVESISRPRSEKQLGEVTCTNAHVPVFGTSPCGSNTSVAGSVNFSGRAHSQTQLSTICSTTSVTCTSLHDVRYERSVSFCNLKPGINMHSRTNSYLTFSTLNGTCTPAVLNKNELSASASIACTTSHTFTQAQTVPGCAVSSDTCTSSQPMCHSAVSTSSFAPAHPMSQEQSHVPYSMSVVNKHDLSIPQLSSFTSVDHIIPRTHPPQITVPSSNNDGSSLLQKKYEPSISAPLATSAVNVYCQTQPHITYTVNRDTCYTSLQQKQDSGVSSLCSSTSDQTFLETDTHMYSVSGGKPLLQHKHEPALSVPLSFSPVYTYAPTQPKSKTQPQSTRNKYGLSLQQKYDSAVPSHSNAPVHILSQTQPPVRFTSSSANCNVSSMHKHEPAVSTLSMLTPAQTFSQLKQSVMYSGSFPSQHKHQSADIFVPTNSLTPEVQAIVVTTTNTVPFPDRNFTTSTFTPVSQVMLDIRNPVSFPNLNCPSSSNSWLPSSGSDKNWFSISKPLNSVSAAHRKTNDSNETISSSANLALQTNEFPSDIFASLQVSSGGQHPESISPTAAFLLAFPLVSSSKVSDMIDPQDVDCDSFHGTSSLLQIGNIDHYTTSKKDTSMVQHAASQTLTSKCQPSSKERTGADVKTGDKTLTDRNFYVSNTLSLFPDHKNDVGSRNAMNMKTSEISAPASSNMMEECIKNNNANQNVETQLKSTDMCKEKCEVTSSVSKQYVPTTFNTQHSSANMSVTNTLAANCKIDQKTNTSIDTHSLFSAAQVSYDASSSSVSFNSEDKSKKSNKDSQFPIVSKRQNFTNSVEMPALKWNPKNDNFEKQISSGTFNARKVDAYNKACLSSDNQEAPILESFQTLSSSVSGVDVSQCVSSATSNLFYNHNFFQGSEHRVTSSHSTCLPTNSGGQTVVGVSSGPVIPSILPWTTSATNIGHCSVFSTAQSVVSHHCPATQYVLPRIAASTANCHYESNPRYLLSSKPAANVSSGQEGVSSSIQHGGNVSSKLSDHCSNKIKGYSQKVAGSEHQHVMENETGLFCSGSVTAAVNSETVDSFKFVLPSDHQQVYPQQTVRPPINWMTTPAVTTTQAKQTFSTYFPTPASMDVGLSNSLQLNDQQLRNNSYFTTPNVDSTIFTSSTSARYSNKTACQDKISSEKQQNTSASVSYANETQSDSDRLAMQNTGVHISQSQQNELCAAPWTQIKPQFSTDAVSSDISSMYVPSTLPTLVGDLALGTGCINNVMEDNNANKSFSNSGYSDIGQHTKEQKLETSGRQAKNRQTSKDTGRKSKHNIDCTQGFGNLTNAVPSSVGSSFLSVSQLVDPTKSAAESSGCQVSLRTYSPSSGKQVLLHNAGSFVKREAPPQSTLSSKDNAKKAERPHNVANNMTYRVEVSRAIQPQHSKQENTKTSVTLSCNTLEYQSVATNSLDWLQPDASSRKQVGTTSSTSYKMQLGTYSAEALIGNNQNVNVNSSIAPSTSHRVISLPPPVVSDRFDKQNNYISSRAPRKMQYGEGAFATGSYNAKPIDLPMSQGLPDQSSSVNNQQAYRTYAGNTLQYSTINSLEPPDHQRDNGGVCSASYFGCGVHDASAISTAQGIMPGLGGSSCDIQPPDGKKLVSFPTLSLSKESCRAKNEKQNFMYSRLASSSASFDQQVGHVHSKIETSSGALSSDKTANCLGNGKRNVGEASQNVASNVSNCLMGKQRGKKRACDTATSASSIGNLVDLGYLTMPPGIGSPMLTDDSVYFGHGANYPGGPAALYPGSSTSAQGSLYAPARVPFSSCSTTGPRSLQLATASPNTSGTTLANFNLSTIFPEIVDKQTSSASEFPAKPADENTQHAQLPATGPCVISAAGYSHALSTNLNTFSRRNPAGANGQW